MLKHTLNTYNSKYKYQTLTLLSHLSFFIYCYFFGFFYFLIAIIIGWVISNLAHYLYIHRIYTHKHFKISRSKHKILMFLFTTLNLGSPAVYAAVHLKHHANSGDKNDPHDPYQLKFIKTFLSLWDDKFIPDRRLLAHYLKDPITKTFHKHHFSIAVASTLITPFFVLMGFYLSKISIIFVHITKFGYGVQKNKDTSINAWYIKFITWGEELHNNHHFNPGAQNHNFKKNFRELDILYFIGKLLEDKKEIEL